MSANQSIGANNPPEPIGPFDALAMHIDGLYELAESALIGKPIETQEQADQIEALKNDIKKAAKDADAARKVEKQPFDDGAKAVQAKWKPLLDRADLCATTAAKALTPWLQKVQAEKDAEQKRLRDEAAAKEAAALAAFQNSAPTDLTARADAEQLAKEAKQASVAANKIDRAATGLRTYWKAQVSDYGALLAYMKKARPDDLRAMLDEYAEKQKNAGARILPGVLFTEEKRSV